MLLKSLKKEDKRCWNYRIESLILYINVIQFYRVYMHWRVLIKSQRTEIIYYIFHETAFSRNFVNINFRDWNIEQSYLVICPSLKLFIKTQCGYVTKSLKKILACLMEIIFVNCYPGNTDIIFLALIFTNKERQSNKG